MFVEICFLFFFGKNIDCIISESVDPETSEKEVNYFTPWKLESKRNDTRIFCLITINSCILILPQKGQHCLRRVPWVEI